MAALACANCDCFFSYFRWISFLPHWPTFQQWLVSVGKSIASMGTFGTFLYGFLMRLSGAVGLHHMIYPLFWYSELGGVEMVNGEMIVGAQKSFCSISRS